MQTTPPTTRRRTGRLAILGTAGVATAAALAMVSTTPFAQAAAVHVDPLEKALGFNVFVQNDTTLASLEAEGAIATGGDLVIDGVYNVALHGAGTFTVSGDAQPSALVVGGTVDFADSTASGVIRVLDNGYVKVGDLSGVDVLTVDGNGAQVSTRLVASGAGYNGEPRIELVTQQPASSVGPASPIDFAAAFIDFRAKAALLAECPNTVAMTDPNGTTVAKGAVASGQQIRITLEEGKTNVLNLTGDDLNNMANLTFLNAPTATAPLLVNVDTSGTGGALDWDVKTQAGIGGSQAPYVLWNFGDTEQLTISSGDTVEGSVYAPNAAYLDVSPTNVEGQIVVKSAGLGAVGENGGEVHDFPFTAELACETDTNPTATVTPNPQTLTPSDSASAGPSTPGASGTGGMGGTGNGGTDETGSTGGTGGASGGNSLATTGDSLRPLVIAAGALIAVGAAVLGAATVRRRSAGNR